MAADGCKFLLCIAGPWASIAECRPVVLEVFRDMARGQPLPSCSMSGDGNAASNLWTSEATCPAMYRIYDQESGSFARCLYPGRISVQVNGSLWSQVYWDFSGYSTTWYSDAAKSMLGQGTTAVPGDQYETDLRNWNEQIQQCAARGGTSRLVVGRRWRRRVICDGLEHLTHSTSGAGRPKCLAR
jgi:hypothetical protein